MYEIKDKQGNTVARVIANDFEPGSFVDEGVWLEIETDDGTKPTICLIKGGNVKDWYVGFYRDANNPGNACDFAITVDRVEGPIIQAVKGDEVASASLFDLLKAFENK